MALALKNNPTVHAAAAERSNQQVIFRVFTAYYDEKLSRENVRVAEAAVEMAGAVTSR